MLGHHASRIDDCREYSVAQGFRQSLMDDLIGPPFIVAREVLDVLKHKCLWLMMIDDIGDGEKEVPLLLIVEAVFASQAVLFG